MCDETAPALYSCACALIFACVLLAAPPVPVRVELPVMVPCVDEVPQRPAYELDKLPASATDGNIILALARDWTRGNVYEQTLEATIYGFP